MLAENTLLKTAYHFLLPLVGFDTLTYKKDYNRPPILVGHQALPSSYDIAIARNPNSLVTPIRISVSPRWPCQLPIISCNYFSLTKIAIDLTKMA